MSHDLRTPLAGLRALAEGLEDGVVDDGAALRQMRLTVERMNGLVRDLFDVSRLRAGPAQEAAPRSMVSLVEVGHDVVGELPAHAARRGCRSACAHPGTATGSPCSGSGDELDPRPDQPRGQRRPSHGGRGARCSSRPTRRRTGNTLGVTDGCGGIDEADLDRVFDLGWRADPERGTHDAGAGLGLAIAKGVAEAHEGSSVS